MPSGSAFVRTTAIVCGWQSSATKKPSLAGLRHRAAQRHRLGGGRGLVEQRRVGERQAGEVGDHRLEVEQRLEPALRDLGLVGRVLRVPARVLEDVAQDDGRRVAVVVAHADEGAAARGSSRPSARSSARACSSLSGERQREGAAEADAGRARSRRRARRARRAPSAFSISAISASLGPMWRRTKSAGGSSRARAPAGAVAEAESDTGILGS